MMNAATDEATRVELLARELAPLVQGVTRAIVLGSGLGDAVADVDDERPFATLPGLPVSAVAGHAGRVVRTRFGSGAWIAALGRVHAYEGHDVHATVRLVRALARAGIREVVLTNASGGIRDDLAPGTFMRIADHLNLTGLDPGVGLGDGPLGPRFPDLSALYDPDLGRRLARAGERASVRLAVGVYAGRLGPSYETPAEITMLERLGADAVGMSTVLEAIALCRMGVRVAGLSCITNRAAGRGGALDHAEVLREGAQAAGRMRALLDRWSEDSE